MARTLVGHRPETDKVALRRIMRRRRRAMSAAEPDAANVAALMLPLAAIPGAEIVSGYHPIGSELDPGPLLARFAENGARIVFPVTLSPETPLAFLEHLGGSEQIPGCVDLRAPSAEGLVPDIIIAPLLAFDRQGGRLGQGAGAYDRTIACLRAQGPVFVLGLAYAGQEVPCVPTEPLDQPLDAILTERGYIAVP
jgi:5-formyltetrahydrofolate cyclo-ligase